MIFKVPLYNLLVNLPDIKDDDSIEAYIKNYKVSPDKNRCNQYVSIIISNSKRFNLLRVNPGRSITKNITCTVSVTIIDVMKTPR